jgi:hypothetical protein
MKTFELAERQGKIMRAAPSGKAKRGKGRRPIQRVQIVRDKREPVELPTDSLGYEVQAFRRPTIKASRMRCKLG